MSRCQDLRDSVLMTILRDLLEHDRRLNGLDLSIEVRGSVAHIAGSVRSEEERCLVRRLASQLRGINAVWDTIQIIDQDPLRIIDIGCGKVKQYSSAIGIDSVYPSRADLIADLERGLPIADRSVDHLFAVHVLEHIRELVVLMNEIHRVLKPAGVLHVLAPHWQHPNAVADPTHVRLLTIDTFKYFCLPHPGIKPFLPLAISATADTVYADLQPVKDGEPLISEDRLSWYFGC